MSLPGITNALIANPSATGALALPTATSTPSTIHRHYFGRRVGEQQHRRQPIPADPIDVRLGNERFEGARASALTSFMKALNPCGVPAARALMTAPGLTGGITPNGVGTFAGPVDQPWVVLP